MTPKKNPFNSTCWFSWPHFYQLFLLVKKSLPYHVPMKATVIWLPSIIFIGVRNISPSFKCDSAKKKYSRGLSKYNIGPEVINVTRALFLHGEVILLGIAAWIILLLWKGPPVQKKTPFDGVSATWSFPRNKMVTSDSHKEAQTWQRHRHHVMCSKSHSWWCQERRFMNFCCWGS